MINPITLTIFAGLMYLVCRHFSCIVYVLLMDSVSVINMVMMMMMMMTLESNLSYILSLKRYWLSFVKLYYLPSDGE